MQIKVLLVDDAKDFVEYMKKRLVSRGMKIYTVYNAEDALEIVHREELDVVVLDILMPGMDGIEALQEIKKIKPELPVIMLTGHGAVESAEDGLKLGAIDYLLKPCDFNTILSSIKNAYYLKNKTV